MKRHLFRLTREPNLFNIKAVYNMWVYPEVTPRGQWIILITYKGLVFSIGQNFMNERRRFSFECKFI